MLRLFQYIFLAWLYIFLLRMLGVMREDIQVLQGEKAVQPAGPASGVREGAEEESPRLVVKTGAGTAPEGREYALLPVTTAGSGADNHVCALGVGMVARHFRIILKNGAFWLEDLSGEPGTYLNGERVGGQVELGTGDEVQAGRVAFVFRR